MSNSQACRGTLSDTCRRCPCGLLTYIRTGLRMPPGVGPRVATRTINAVISRDSPARCYFSRGTFHPYILFFVRVSAEYRAIQKATLLRQIPVVIQRREWRFSGIPAKIPPIYFTRIFASDDGSSHYVAAHALIPDECPAFLMYRHISCRPTCHPLLTE